MQYMVNLGNRIKLRRKELKITQVTLVELSGISLNTLSRIEGGKANPTIEMLSKIADILGLELKLEVKNA